MDPLPRVLSSVSLRAAGMLWFAAVAFFGNPVAPVFGQVEYPGRVPGPAESSSRDTAIVLENQTMRMLWSVGADGVLPDRLDDKANGKTIRLSGDLFQITLAEGGPIRSSKMKMTECPIKERVEAAAASARAGDHFPGWRFRAKFCDEESGLSVTWQAELRDGANYVRQSFGIDSGKRDTGIKDVHLLCVRLDAARVAGTAAGSPIVNETTFAGIEDPMAKSEVSEGEGRCLLHVGVPIRKGQNFTRGTVVGVAPVGQLRRGFLFYLERERAHPYRPFLHYNSWWDIGMNKIRRYTQAECLDRIEAFCEELVKKRGVTMSSFLFDDGWDDTDTVWEFTPEFPRGFAPLREAAERHGVGLGIWLSPFGGYNGATGAKHTHRTNAGKAAGYELNSAGFALSGAKYFGRFRDVTVGMIKNYGVNMFKFDGLSRNTIAPPGSPFSSDFQAAIKLLEELRVARGDVFINLTTGTWPSPFWTLLCDSIWRGGKDSGSLGVGSKRQQWMTYRDAFVYKNVVMAGELYPLNSLMTHGIIFCRSNGPLKSDPEGDLVAEARSYFGSGTQLQELYCTPSLLKSADWDTLAETAKWARRWAGVLVDTHWIGGDPEKLEVYGWAAWTPKGAVLTLRNPSDRAQEFSVSAQEVFGLPEGASRVVRLHRSYKDQRLETLQLEGTERKVIQLKPFEVLVFDTGD